MSHRESTISRTRRCVLAAAGLLVIPRAFGRYSSAFPEDFGAKGDGVADDSESLRGAISASHRVRLKAGRRYAVRNVAVPTGVRINGDGATIVETEFPNPSGEPMLHIVGNDVGLANLRFEGARATHRKVGLSDSFEGGAKRTGRAFLAAVRIDAGEDDLSGVELVGCEFREIHGACVAARHVSRLLVSRCQAVDTNFELLFMANARRVRDIVVSDNRLERVGTGDVRVNANGIVIGNASSVSIVGNTMVSVERNAVKLEQSCEDVRIFKNEMRGNSIDNFGFVQVQSLGDNSSTGIVIDSNVAQDVGAGFSFNAVKLSRVTIIRNQIEGTHGPTTGDGVQLANGQMADIEILDNIMTGIHRHGIVIGNERLGPRIERVRIANNEIRLSERSPGAAVQVTAPPLAIREEGQVVLGKNVLCGSARHEQVRVLPAADAEAIRFIRFESPLFPCL